MQASGGSAHFVVGLKGQIIQCVSLEKRAYHFGEGHLPSPAGPVRSWPDRWAVGIEVANRGRLVQKEVDVAGVEHEYYYERNRVPYRYKREKYGEPEHGVLHLGGDQVVEAWWEPYPDDQIKALVMLCHCLRQEFGIPLKRIVGHEDVAHPAGRKTDPGPLFPWKAFMQELAAVEGLAELPEDLWDHHMNEKGGSHVG